MKKSMILMAAACAVAMTAAAEWEKIGYAQLADSSRLSAAVVKLAEYSGNQMLGLMLSGAVQNPFADDFGPAREGEDINAVLFLDKEKALTARPEEGFASFEFAVIYPIASTRDQFIAGHAGGVFTNGLYRVRNDEDEFDDDDDKDKKREKREFLYYAFSEDGRFVAHSDVAEQAKIAIAELKNFKPLKSDLARFVLEPRAWAMLKKQVAACKDADEDVRRMAAAIDSLAASVGMYDGGIEFALAGTVGKQGVLANVGKMALGDRLFASAPTNSVAAFDYAKNSAFKSALISELWGEIKPVLMKHKIRTDFLKIAKQGMVESIVFDHAGFFKYLLTKEETLKSVDGDQLSSDLKLIFEKYGAPTSYEQLTEARSSSLSLTGYAAKHSPAKHFARTMRGLDTKNAALASVVSISGLINAIVPAMEANGPEADRSQLAAIRKALPPEGEGATAFMMTRKDDRLKLVLRIDGDELKPFGCMAGAIMGAMMMQK